MKELFQEYQQFTPTTALYPGANEHKQDELLYLTLGIWGELQEWDESGHNEKEAGDVLYYLSQLCNYYGEDLHYILCERDPTYIQINIAENLKKMIRDGKKIDGVVLQLMENVICIFKDYYSEMHFAAFIQNNMNKLTSRKERGVIQGDGNER